MEKRSNRGFSQMVNLKKNTAYIGGSITCRSFVKLKIIILGKLN
jgi:hypothetical protein